MKTLGNAEESKKTHVAQVVRHGDKLMIPDAMSLDDAMAMIGAKKLEEEQTVDLNTNFDCFIWEGCYALAGALDKKFGWFHQIGTGGFFFDNPPTLHTVDIGPIETVQVPWGKIQVPSIPENDGYFETGYHIDGSMVCFALKARIKRKHTNQYNELCREIREQLRTSSLYKGKIVSIDFTDGDGDTIKFPEPRFPIIVKLTPEDTIFSRSLEAQIKANLYTPITKAQRCRDEGIPLKRGVALVGPFGTGKTLIATVTANMAKEHGWTFLFCRNATDFPKTVAFARQYQPAVVFCEDIDKVTSGERDEAMDLVLNTIDGVVSKGNELVLVLTSNEVEKIYPGMLRPGRLDAVISVDPPDAEAVQRLLRFYGKGLIASDVDLERVGDKLAGNTPAVIREVVERAKLTALSLSDNLTSLSSEALEIAVDTMQSHLKLLNKKAEKPVTGMEVLGNVVGQYLLKGLIHAGKYPEVAALANREILKDLPHVVLGNGELRK